MPGGYTVYILMEKTEGKSLQYDSYWDENIFSSGDRQDVRNSFRQALKLVRIPRRLITLTVWQRGGTFGIHSVRPETRKSDVEQDIKKMVSFLKGARLTLLLTL